MTGAGVTSPEAKVSNVPDANRLSGYDRLTEVLRRWEQTRSGDGNSAVTGLMNRSLQTLPDPAPRST